MSSAGWIHGIESRAYHRLGELRERRLWDGRPPVPVDHVIEHLLGLTVTYEVVVEEAGEKILGCLRPERREIVLNERYAAEFGKWPGVERYTKAHEAGHADVFAAVARATEQRVLFEQPQYQPVRRSGANGPVDVIGVRLPERLRGCSRETRTEVMIRLRDLEVQAIAEGQDSPIVRRGVEHYAATLLMPEDLVREHAADTPSQRGSRVRALAQRFQVSLTAMDIRLEELGLSSSDGGIVEAHPRRNEQWSLF